MSADSRSAALGMDGSDARDAEANSCAALIRDFQAGGPEAFEALVRRHEALVLRLATRLLGNADDALDASQEAFIRCYRALPRFDSRRPLEPWLRRIVTNVCRDYYKKRRRREEADGRAAESAGEASAAACLELREVIALGLETLTGRERAAFVLRDMEGLSSKEAAKAMGCAAVTARTLAARARMKLRKFYQAQIGDA